MLFFSSLSYANEHAFLKAAVTKLNSVKQSELSEEDRKSVQDAIFELGKLAGVLGKEGANFTAVSDYVCAYSESCRALEQLGMERNAEKMALQACAEAGYLRCVVLNSAMIKTHVWDHAKSQNCYSAKATAFGSR